MEIHKPKPWHSLREFLKEYLIIVIGVLTALGAEQGVEAIHHHAQAGETRETIRAEVVTDITRMQQRDFARGCVDARLAEIDRIVDGAAPNGRIRRPSWIGDPPRYGIETVRWDAASQSGRVSLMPSDWQAHFGFVYTTLRYFYEMNNAEQPVWARLDALSGVDQLTADGKLSVKADVAQARFYNGSIRQVADILRNRAAAEGLQPTGRHDPPNGVCWSIDTPTEEGLARVAAASIDQRR
jgi:hypothetical protein